MCVYSCLSHLSYSIRGALVPYRTLARLAQKKSELAAPFIVLREEIVVPTLVSDHSRSRIASADAKPKTPLTQQSEKKMRLLLSIVCAAAASALSATTAPKTPSTRVKFDFDTV